MTQQITAALLQEAIQSKLLNGRAVAPDEELLLSGLLDSLGVMALVSFIEETRGTRIPPEDVTLENFTSIKTILAYLENG